MTSCGKTFWPAAIVWVVQSGVSTLAGSGSVAAFLRQYGYEGEIVLVGEEPYAPYQRPPLSKAWLKGEADSESLLLRRPGLLIAAVLFRAMFAYEPDPLPDLKGTSVFFAAGRLDPLVPRENIERTVDLFKRTGADVRLTWYPRGHGLAYDEIQSAHLWLQQKHLSE